MYKICFFSNNQTYVPRDICSKRINYITRNSEIEYMKKNVFKMVTKDSFQEPHLKT